jgi:hypothetical protein
MCTFRLSFQSGRDEWLTCHTPWSWDGLGAWKLGGGLVLLLVDGEEDFDVVGRRRMMGSDMFI